MSVKINRKLTFQTDLGLFAFCANVTNYCLFWAVMAKHSCRDQITGEHSRCFRLRFWPVAGSYGLPLLAVRVITQTPPAWSWTQRPEPSFSMKGPRNQTCSFFLPDLLLPGKTCKNWNSNPNSWNSKMIRGPTLNQELTSARRWDSPININIWRLNCKSPLHPEPEAGGFPQWPSAMNEPWWSD